jgi:hypothetical protein
MGRSCLDWGLYCEDELVVGSGLGEITQPSSA